MPRTCSWGWTGLLGGVMLIIACVTINIYFPAEKVESVAEEIVNEIRPQEGIPPADPGEKNQSGLRSRSWVSVGWSTAWAQDVTTVSNATIRALKDRMKTRFAALKPYYGQGLLREGADGYVAAGDLGGLPLKEKRDVAALVEAENRDRRELYQEVAKALNIDSSQISRIGAIFATEWQKTVP